MLFNLKSEQGRECHNLNCTSIPHEGRKPSFGRDWGARNVRKNDVRGSRDTQHVQMLKDDGSMMIVSFVSYNFWHGKMIIIYCGCGARGIDYIPDVFIVMANY